MRTRRGKYDEAIRGILEYLVTSTGDGRAIRPELEKKFGLKESSASDVFKKMKSEGLVEVRKFTVQKMDTIKITEKGRAEYQSRYQRGEYRLPPRVRKYLEHQGIREDQFFPIQQNFVNRGLIFNRKNVCVFGYPGAGKTLVAEMAMAHEVGEDGKVLYCTPYKALDWQKYNDFLRSFKVFPDVKILVADGDNRVSEENLLESNIIIATYEWALRAIREKDPWLGKVSLVCADEITLLGDEERGGSIDTAITSLRCLDQKPRIITMSSLVGNALQISKWLGAELLIENRPAFQMPIQEYVVSRENDKLVMMNKDGVSSEMPLDESSFKSIVGSNLKQGKTTIVFIGFKKGVENIASRLVSLHEHDQTLQKMSEEFLLKIRHRTKQVEDACKMISYGVAYHHAGLQKPLRKFIEDLLAKNMLKTVVATTTLSHGVNYRIDSAVIDLGMFDIVKGGLPVVEYINLKGRTGRPGMSKSADVYLIAGITRLNHDEIFTKYFLSSPESIQPKSTFDDNNLESLILSNSVPELNKNKIVAVMKGTLQYFRNQGIEIELNSRIRNLKRVRFLNDAGKKTMATDLGKNVLKSNLSPSDATKVLSLHKNSNINDILSLAMEIDIAKRTGFVGKLGMSKLQILKMWMSGKSLDDIRKEAGEFFDQELLDLASYTALSLKKMSILLKDNQLKRRILPIVKKINGRF